MARNMQCLYCNESVLGKNICRDCIDDIIKSFEADSNKNSLKR